MKPIELIDIAFSFLFACFFWHIIFGSGVVVESSILAFTMYPILGFFGVVFELFKLVSFFVIFLSIMFVFEQLILIVRSFIDEYDSKIGISDKKKEDEEK